MQEHSGWWHDEWLDRLPEIRLDHRADPDRRDGVRCDPICGAEAVRQETGRLGPSDGGPSGTSGAGSLQGGNLRGHALAVRRYPRIPVDHALLMAVTYAKEKAKDINGRKILHNS